MTKYGTSLLLILALIIVLITPVCTMSADPTRMDEMLFEQRNDVHSLAANMYNTLRNPDNREMTDRLINETIGFRHTEEIIYDYNEDSAIGWDVNLKRDEQNNLLNEIYKELNPDSLRSCKIIMNKFPSGNKAYYSDDKRITHEEAKLIIRDIRDSIEEEIGYVDAFLQHDPNTSSQEGDKRLRDLELKRDQMIPEHPEYPTVLPIVKYNVKLIPEDETHFVSFDIQSIKGLAGYSSPIHLSLLLKDEQINTYYGD